MTVFASVCNSPLEKVLVVEEEEEEVQNGSTGFVHELSGPHNECIALKGRQKYVITVVFSKKMYHLYTNKILTNQSIFWFVCLLIFC